MFQPPRATTQHVVRACEQAEALHLARQVAALTVVAPALRPVATVVAGGTAALTVPAFGRKLNHVAGAWLEEPMTEQQLRELERAYLERSLALEIDLCPYGPAENLEQLARSGYCVNAYMNMYWLDLSVPPSASDAGATCSVDAVGDDEHEAFVATSIEGFAAQSKPRPSALLEALARVALAREDSVLYAAKWEGAWVATAGLALLETECGLIAHLYLASVLPQHRRRGLHAALLRHRLRDARARGATLACVTARLGTSSAQNLERGGMSLAYTKPTFARRIERGSGAS